MWRSRWAFNYFDFLSRVLSAAAWLLEARGPVLIVVPTSPHLKLPRFYNDVCAARSEHVLYRQRVIRATRAITVGQVLAAFGTVTSDSHVLEGLEVPRTTVCCVNAGGHYNVSAAAQLVARVLHHYGFGRFVTHLRPSGAPPSSAAPGGLTLVSRTPPPWSKPPAQRAITTAARLLADCAAARIRRSLEPAAAPCSMINFERSTFASTLEQLQRTSILVGMHGAGLANAIFLPPGGLLVEVLPSAFTAPPSFGLHKYDLLGDVGMVARQQLIAKESSAACAAQARGVSERLRECDVDLRWAEVERAILHARSGK